MLLTAIGRLTLLVDDQGEALRWYRDVLGFEVLHDSVTDDLDAVLERLRGHDVEFWDVREDGHSRSLHLRDLLGNVIVVAELR